MVAKKTNKKVQRERETVKLNGDRAQSVLVACCVVIARLSAVFDLSLYPLRVTFCGFDV
jgi:hypothetical protein